MTKQKTLKNFLEKHNACKDGFKFAKDLTLEQFLNTCERGDWILWLFKRTNPDSLTELTLAKALSTNTVRHLMEDERSTNSVDVAIKFGNGQATRQELDAAYADADAAATAYAYAYANATTYADAYAAATATAAANAAAYAADANAYANAATAYANAATADADAATADAYAAARKQNQKATADICRKTLRLEIWDQSEF